MQIFNFEDYHLSEHSDIRRFLKSWEVDFVRIPSECMSTALERLYIRH